MSFETDLKAEFEHEKPTVDVPVTLNKSRYVFRVTAMDPFEWVDATDRAPARGGVLIDAQFGYNLRALVLLVAPQCIRRVDGDALVELSEDEWRDLFKALPGGAVARFGDAVFQVNQIGAEEAVEAAKKAFAAMSGR